MLRRYLLERQRMLPEVDRLASGVKEFALQTKRTLSELSERISDLFKKQDRTEKTIEALQARILALETDLHREVKPPDGSTVLTIDS